MSVVEALVIIQYNVLVLRSWYTGNVVVERVSWMSFVCRGCMNPVTSTGCTSVDIGVNANLDLVDFLLFR